jgi:hypothetical protein
MLGISGLLQLLTWVEHRRVAQASQHEEGGVPCPIPHPTRLPPPDSRQVTSRWADLPLTNQQRLLWLLSHLLERQLGQSLAPGKEDGDELDECAE